MILAVNLFGIPLIILLSNHFRPEETHNISIFNSTIANIAWVTVISILIIGVWLYLIAEKFQLHKWTWFLMGLVYGQLAIILFALIVIFYNIRSRIDLFRSLRPIFILMMISVLLNYISSFVLLPYLLNKLNVEGYQFAYHTKNYLRYFMWGVDIVMNIVLAVKLIYWIGEQNMDKDWVWITATIFFGLFTIIFFNEIVIIRRNQDVPFSDSI